MNYLSPFCKVGVHKGSALNPLLFIIFMDVLMIKDVRNGSLMELLYADIILSGESVEKVMKKYRKRFKGKCSKN